MLARMSAAYPIPPNEIIGTADERVMMHAARWEQFETLLTLRGDGAAPRMAYLEGELELMSPSRGHEGVKSTIARLIELYADAKGVRLNRYGSWTLRNAPKASAVEPDECYIEGDPRTKDLPDLTIEVIWTSGGLDKIEAYRRIGIRELWQWKAGTIRVFQLRDEVYVETPSSSVLPGIDIGLVASLATYDDQNEALTALRRSLGGI